MPKLTAQDQAALARYLNILRDTGPGMDSRLVDAFERLTPAQLDALVELTLDDAGTAEKGAAPPATETRTPSSQNAVTAPHPELPQEKKRSRLCGWFGDNWAWVWVLLLLE